MAIIAGWLCATNAQADEGNPDAGNRPAERPFINFEVLQTSRINLGNRSAIFNLVAPPVLPTAPTPVAPVAAQPPTAAELQAAEQRMLKKEVALFISATVIDRSVTSLSWQQEGRRYRAFSNVDFNFLCGINGIETADSVYWFIMGLGNETREEAEVLRAAAAEHGLPEFAVPVPLLSEFSATRAEYAVVGEAETAPTDAFKGVDALHVYFDAHREQLIADYAKRTAENAAREQWLKDHPPVPQDTVINFWPVKSTNYPAQQNGGQP